MLFSIGLGTWQKYLLTEDEYSSNCHQISKIKTKVHGPFNLLFIYLSVFISQLRLKNTCEAFYVERESWYNSFSTCGEKPILVSPLMVGPVFGKKHDNY